MKFDISVEIDWLGDEAIDEVIQNKIIESVVERVSKQVMNKVSLEASKTIESRVDDLVTKTFTDFLEKGVTVTDQWGDKIKEDIKILDLIKQKADKWLTEPVDREGRPDRNSWGGGTYKRIDWFIDQRLDKETKRMSDEIVKKVNDTIKKHINDSVKDAIGEKLVKEIGLENIINSHKAKG